VHADVEAKAFALERLRQAAGLAMPLQHQHASPGPAQRGRGGQAADARADDDGIELRLHAITPRVRCKQSTIAATSS